GARGHERPGVQTPIGEEEGRPIYLFSTDSPLRSMTGDFESMALYAGTGVGHVTAIRSAAEVVREIAEEARRLTTVAAGRRIEVSSATCYAGEMSGSYMGQLEPAEQAAELAAVVAGLQAGLRAVGAPAGDDMPPFPAAAREWARWIVALEPFAVAGGDTPAAAAPADPVLLRTA